VTEEERYQAHLKQQVQDALEATHKRLRVAREKKDVWTVHEWIKQYVGNLSRDKVSLIVGQGLYMHWNHHNSGNDWLHDAAEWVRLQHPPQAKEPT
jgi:hypothetical protein